MCVLCTDNHVNSAAVGGGSEQQGAVGGQLGGPHAARVIIYYMI